MAQYEVQGDEKEGFTWRLMDGDVIAGVSAVTYASRALAGMAMALVAAGPQQYETKIEKNSTGRFRWTVAVKDAGPALEGEAYGKSASDYADRKACTKSAGRFKALLRDAKLPSLPPQPRAIFTAAPAQDGTALAIEFDASASQAPGTTIAAFAWEFGDSAKGEGISIRHVFQAPGQYTVTLVVRDRLGSSGTARRDVTVVQPAPTPAPSDLKAPDLDHTGITRMHEAVQFLYSGESAVQTEVEKGAIKAHRAAVVRGLVQGRKSGEAKPAALSGVMIRVKGRPELGTTRTRESGAFDMAVNGGTTLTIEFEKEGYLPVSRRVDVPWEDYVTIREVGLTPRASASVSKLNLRSDAPMHVAHGSIVDAEKPHSRQARLLLPAGLAISSRSESAAAALSSSPSVSLVEFTTGPDGHAAMPALLPPNSGYTYAIDLSFESGSDVSFDRPVIHYVENFLKFPVGSAVPSGYFDLEKDCWLPAKNGRVIQVLNVESGLATIDIDGKGAASSQKLRAFGIDEAEQRQLGQLYRAGQSLWRVEISHFSAWDFNWPYGPPADAKAPDAPDPQDAEQEANSDAPDSECGSLISVQSQVLGESIPITGSPFALCYSSDRVPGRKVGFSLAIPLTSTALPKSMKGVELEIQIAGQEFARSFEPAPNLEHAFVWDGRDAYGRKLQGRHPVKTRVGYRYGAVYQDPAEHEQSFARYSGNATANPARQEFTLWREWTGALGVWDARGTGLGGWTVDVHHFFDPIGRVLYMGDGTRHHYDAGLGGASIVAFAGENEKAEVKIDFLLPSGVAVDGQGNVFIAQSSRKVLKITPKGETILHFDTPPILNQGGFGRAKIGSDGFLYAADTTYDCILRLAPDGGRVVSAGPDGDNSSFGPGGFGGDGGPAAAAKFNRPASVALAADGTVYIADTANRRVRRLGTDGIVTTVGGNGEEESEGDGGPALQAGIGDPVDVAVGPDGSLYIADYNGLIRRVAPDGTINTFAGTGEQWTGEEDARLLGGPATSIALHVCTAVAVGSDGAVYIASTSSGGPSLVWRVDPTGLMSLLAGSGKKKPGPRLPATEVALPDISALAMAADGTLYLAGDDATVYKIEAPFEGRVLGEIILPDETGSQLFVFDARGRHLRTLDAFDGTERHKFVYDASGRLSAVNSGAEALLLSIERNAAGEPTALVTAGKHRHSLQLERDRFLSAIEVEGRGRFDFTYAEGGLLTSFKRPWGLTNRYAYDELGRLSRDENSDGGATDLFRAPRERGFEVRVLTKLPPLFREKSYVVERQSDGGRRRVNRCCTSSQSVEIGADGARTVRAADGTIRVAKMQPDPRLPMFVPLLREGTIETPGGLKSSMSLTRKVTPRQDARKFPLGFEDTFLFNEDDQRASHLKFDPEKRTLTYRAGKRVLEMVMDESGRVTIARATGRPEVAFEYDTKGNLVGVTEGGAKGRSHAYSYDQKGTLIAVSNPIGRTLQFTVDEAARSLRARHSDGRELQTRFDVRGRLVAIRPPGGAEHTFKYIGSGLLSEYTPPAVPNCDATIRWEYDLIGQLSRVTKGGGKGVEFHYDEAGRVVGVTGPGLDTKFERDPLSGRTIRLSALSGVRVEFEFDGMLATRTAFSGPIFGEISQMFANDFRIETQAIAGREISFSYDEEGSLAAVDRIEIKRNASGAVARLEAGGVSVAFDYDAFGGIVRQRVRNGSAALLDIAFTRDGLGRVIEQTETRGRTSVKIAIAYDAGGRIAKETRDGAEVDYAYDDNGNQVSRGGPAATKASLDAQDRLLRHGDWIFEYEPDGTLRRKTDSKSGKTWEYHFDPLGGLTEVRLPDGTKLGYLHDGFGRRVGETLDGKLTRGFFYHETGFPLAQLDARGKVVARFVYVTRRHVPDLIITSEQTFLIASDPLGSPRLVIDVDSGEVAQRMEFDGFGRVIEDTKPGFQPFGFAGGLHEPRTGLTHFGAREYDSEIGRWTAKDPILFEGGDTNLYAYCGNDPINCIDPSGRDLLPPGLEQFESPFYPLNALLLYTCGNGSPVPFPPEVLIQILEAYNRGVVQGSPQLRWGHLTNFGLLMYPGIAAGVGGWGFRPNTNPGHLGHVLIWDVYTFNTNDGDQHNAGFDAVFKGKNYERSACWTCFSKSHANDQPNLVAPSSRTIPQ